MRETDQLSSLTPFVQSIWELLQPHCESAEEVRTTRAQQSGDRRPLHESSHPLQGTRNLVSECLGKLVLVDPAFIVPLLEANLSSPAPHARATAVRCKSVELVLVTPAGVGCQVHAAVQHARATGAVVPHGQVLLVHQGLHVGCVPVTHHRTGRGCECAAHGPCGADIGHPRACRPCAGHPARCLV